MCSRTFLYTDDFRASLFIHRLGLTGGCNSISTTPANQHATSNGFGCRGQQSARALVKFHIRIIALAFQTCQTRSFVCTLGPAAGTCYILGAIGFLESSEHRRTVRPQKVASSSRSKKARCTSRGPAAPAPSPILYGSPMRTGRIQVDESS